MNNENKYKEGSKMNDEQLKNGNEMRESTSTNSSEEPKQMINESITVIWIDKLLNFLRNGYFLDFFEKNEKFLIKYGLYGLYVSGILGLVASLVLPIRYKLSYGYSMGVGVSWFFLCIMMHYIASKFLPNILNIINSTPTKFSSQAFLDSLAVIAGIIGIISLIGGVYLWAKTSSVEVFVISIFIFIFCEYILSICLKPKLINIEITKKTTAGEEFIGLLSFFLKSYLKLIPIMFGSGIIFGIINMLELLFMKFDYMWQITMKAKQVGNLTSAALLPITGYLLFLLLYFMIDLAKSLLVIPEKLDALKKQD